MESQIGKSGLPENAHRELKPANEYHPVMPANLVFPEVTLWSVFLGLFMAVVFSAAAAYSGLKLGRFSKQLSQYLLSLLDLLTLLRKKILSDKTLLSSLSVLAPVLLSLGLSSPFRLFIF
jgi:hypothetical protein